MRKNLSKDGTVFQIGKKGEKWLLQDNTPVKLYAKFFLEGKLLFQSL